MSNRIGLVKGDGRARPPFEWGGVMRDIGLAVWMA